MDMDVSCEILPFSTIHLQNSFRDMVGQICRFLRICSSLPVKSMTIGFLMISREVKVNQFRETWLRTQTKNLIPCAELVILSPTIL